MFQEQHGVSFTCGTVYTHTAVSLKNENDLIVLFQNQVQSDQKLVDYKSYKNHGNVQDFMLPAIDKSELPQTGPFFNLMKTSGMFGESRHMVSQSRRYVDEIYANCRPVFSMNQELVCLQRGDSSRMIDVFRCDEEDQGFFRSDNNDKRPLSATMSCPEYCFSIQMGRDGGHDETVIEFSNLDMYMAVRSEKSIQIYNVPDFKNDHERSLRLDSEKSRVSINEIKYEIEEEKQNDSAALKPLYKFDLVNQTYSRILSCYMSEEHEDMASKSWVVLESKAFNTLHFIILQDLPDINTINYDGNLETSEEEEQQPTTSRLLLDPNETN